MDYLLAYNAITAVLAIFGGMFFAKIHEGYTPEFNYRKMRIASYVAMIGIINVLINIFFFHNEPKEIKTEQHTCKYCHKVEYKIIKE